MNASGCLVRNQEKKPARGVNESGAAGVDIEVRMRKRAQRYECPRPWLIPLLGKAFPTHPTRELSPSRREGLGLAREGGPGV